MTREASSLASRSRPKKRSSSCRRNGSGPTKGLVSAATIEFLPALPQFRKELARSAPVNAQLELFAVGVEVFPGVAKLGFRHFGADGDQLHGDVPRIAIDFHEVCQAAQQHAEIQVIGAIPEKQQSRIRERFLDLKGNALGLARRVDQKVQ